MIKNKWTVYQIEHYHDRWDNYRTRLLWDSTHESEAEAEAEIARMLERYPTGSYTIVKETFNDQKG